MYVCTLSANRMLPREDHLCGRPVGLYWHPCTVATGLDVATSCMSTLGELRQQHVPCLSWGGVLQTRHGSTVHLD
jgi:hypothetical protein